MGTSWHIAIKVFLMERFRLTVDKRVPAPVEYWAEVVMPRLEATLTRADERGFEGVIAGRRRAELAIGNVAVASYSGIWRKNARLIGAPNALRICRIHRGRLKIKSPSGEEWIINAGSSFVSGPDVSLQYDICPVEEGGVAMIGDMTTIPLNRLKVYGLYMPPDLTAMIPATPLLAAFNAYVDALRSEETPDRDLKRLIANFTELAACCLSFDGKIRSTPVLVDVYYLQALEVITERFRDARLDSRKVASIVGVSERTLFKAFEARQDSFHERMIMSRCGEAEKQVRLSNEPISSIAFGCGFDSIATFNRNFRNRFGCSPSEYRKCVRERK